MNFKRRKRRNTARWLMIAGVVVSGAAAAYAISRLLQAGLVARRRATRALEKAVMQALLSDEVARSEAIDIAAVGAGIIELAGVVGTKEAARHVVEIANQVPGVHAVVNRLEIQADEARLQHNRKRNEGTTTRWYGGSIGIGRRRQSSLTDPARRDDHASLLSRALQPNRDDALTDVEENEGTGVRIGVSRAGALKTNVAPHSPDAGSDRPGAPPAVAPHDRAQPQ